MSEAESFNCPYCDEHYWDCLHEYFDKHENSTFLQCDKCEKNFKVIRELVCNFEAEKIPCMNGEDHILIPMYSIKDNEYWECQYCGKITSSEDKYPEIIKDAHPKDL